MTITGIRYRFFLFSKNMDHLYDADIPFAGDDLVITDTIVDSNETRIRRSALPEETIDQFKELINKYNITDWVGKPAPAPKIYDDDKTHYLSSLTLKFEDGSSADVTFREVPGPGDEAAVEFRKLFFDSVSSDRNISEEHLYPNLKECRKIKEEHGPVTAVETDSYTSGMMMGSNESCTQLVEKIPGKEGRVLVTIKKKRGNGSEITDSKETDSDIFTKVQEISDKENLPSWHYCCKDPSIPVDTSMMPTDFTSSGWLNIYYDDSLISGCPRIKRTIGKTACEMGGSEVDRVISEMVNACVKASGAKVELPALPMTAFPFNMQPENLPRGLMTEPEVNSEGSWKCSCCGTSGLTGKFCENCGMKRPQS
jgi:hypothetical protein